MNYISGFIWTALFQILADFFFFLKCQIEVLKFCSLWEYLVTHPTYNTHILSAWCNISLIAFFSIPQYFCLSLFLFYFACCFSQEWGIVGRDNEAMMSSFCEGKNERKKIMPKNEDRSGGTDPCPPPPMRIRGSRDAMVSAIVSLNYSRFTQRRLRSALSTQSGFLTANG